MKRFTGFAAVVSMVGALLGVGSIGDRAALGQTAVAPPPSPSGGSVPVELGPQTRRLGEELRVLGDLIAKNLGATPQGARLLEESRELGQAIREFHETLRERTDRFEARRIYSGIDASLHNLFSQLSQPGTSSPAIALQSQKMGESDRLIHRAIGLNDYPAGYYGGGAPLSGMIELQRLTHALVDRAEALAVAVRADVAGPANAGLIEEAANLARVADIYHDTLDLEGQIDMTVRNAFAGVNAMAVSLQADLAQVPVTARVRSAWKAYHAAEVLIRRALGLTITPEQLADSVLIEMPGGGSPVAELGNQLVKRTAEFVRAFRPTASTVPEGPQFLADAQALEAEAANFRQDAARVVSPGQLAFEFRAIDAIWQRLARRTNRLARGQTGPHIQQIERIGQTVGELHRLLAIPGYPPAVGTWR